MSKVKTIKAKYSGEIDLNGFKISCAVLEDGTRVFSERSLANAFGIKGGGTYWQKKKNEKSSGAVLPEYLSAKYLTPFITNDLREKLSGAVSYISLNKTESTGVDATVLADICDVYITARNNGINNEKFVAIAENAYSMIKAFAKVGIIALVDEATGYQYDRESQELQKILSAYISNELLTWQQRFPHEFYKEIFRLRGWDYTAANIKTKPSVVGTWTNNLVYNQLPKGVLQELKKQTPKDDSGKRKHHFHRLLTEDIGHPHLQKQIVSVVTLMNISDSWEDFIRLFNKKFGQQQLAFDEPNEKIYDQDKLSDFNQNLKKALDFKSKD